MQKENPYEFLIKVVYWRIQSVMFQGVRATSGHVQLLLVEVIVHTFSGYLREDKPVLATHLEMPEVALSYLV